MVPKRDTEDLASSGPSLPTTKQIFFLINKGQNPALVVFTLIWVKPPEAAPRVHACVALIRCFCMRQQRHSGKSIFLLGNAFRVLPPSGKAKKPTLHSFKWILFLVIHEMLSFLSALYTSNVFPEGRTCTFPAV